MGVLICIKHVAGMALSGGNVGHISVTVSLRANNIDLERIKASRPGLYFEKAPPIPEKIILRREKYRSRGKSRDLTIYARGKMIEGISVTNSFWPSKSPGYLRFFASMFRVGGGVPGVYNNLTDDKIAEADNESRMIHHHVQLKDAKSKGLKPKSAREQKCWDLLNQQANMMNHKSQLNRQLEKIRSQYMQEIAHFSKIYPSTTNMNAIKDGIDYGFLESLTLRKQNLEKSKRKYEHKLEKIISELIQRIDNPRITRELKKLLHNIQVIKSVNAIDPRKKGIFFDAEQELLETKTALQCLEVITKLKSDRKTILSGKQMEKLFTSISETEADISSLDAVIKGVTGLQNQILKIEKEKAEDEKELFKIQNEIQTLSFEIDEYEKSPGKNPDCTVSFPTSENGCLFYLDEELILEHMERQRQNAQYDLFGENCARSVKRCLIAGINEYTQQEILKLKGVPKNFFSHQFSEIPSEVQQWALDLSKYLKQLNDPELRATSQRKYNRR